MSPFEAGASIGSVGSLCCAPVSVSVSHEVHVGSFRARRLMGAYAKIMGFQ